MTWGKWGRKRCRAVAEAGIPGGCIPRGGVAWSLLAPAFGPCSPVEAEGRSGTVSPGGSPLSQLEEAQGTQAAPLGPHQQQRRWQPCWGQDRLGTGAAAWADDPYHPDLRERRSKRKNL